MYMRLVSSLSIEVYSEYMKQIILFNNCWQGRVINCPSTQYCDLNVNLAGRSEGVHIAS